MQPRVDADVVRALLAASSLSIVVHGADGAVLDANRAFADLLGYTLDEACRLTADDVIHPDDLPRRNAEAHDLFAGHTDDAVVHRRLVRKDGSTIRARVRKTVIDVDGAPVVMVVIEEWSRVGDLEHRAWHDELTGLLNRRGLREHAAVTFPAQHVVLAMIDVDGLKQVNDNHGHAAGDALLASVAETLRVNAPPEALVSRWAGDEFVLLTPLREKVTVSFVVVALRHHVSAPIKLPGSQRTVVPSISVGATVYQPIDENLDDALERADALMYRDKQRRATGA